MGYFVYFSRMKEMHIAILACKDHWNIRIKPINSKVFEGCKCNYVDTNETIVVQLPSSVELFATLWTVVCQAPCPSPSSRVCPSLCSLNRWYHPAISSSDALFSFCPQSFSVSGTFSMNHLFNSHLLSKILELQLQHQSLGWIFRVDLPYIPSYSFSIFLTYKMLTG